MKSRLSWLALLGAVMALGSCTAYYALFHDWRGRFTAEQLTMDARVSGSGLELALRNVGGIDLVVHDGPGRGSPYVVVLEGEGAPAGGFPAAFQAPPGRSRILRRGEHLVWTQSLRSLFPDAPPGRYTLRAAYDPSAAAKRGDPCALELTLGRAEAAPLAVTVPAGK
ncbi:MAG TPA: hypothetical protein PK280_07280 [Planctomycetota bacterium]|nr:hypothetical protein [Planctomycetota bacterium]